MGDSYPELSRSGESQRCWEQMVLLDNSQNPGEQPRTIESEMRRGKASILPNNGQRGGLVYFALSEPAGQLTHPSSTHLPTLLAANIVISHPSTLSSLLLRFLRSIAGPSRLATLAPTLRRPLAPHSTPAQAPSALGLLASRHEPRQMCQCGGRHLIRMPPLC